MQLTEHFSLAELTESDTAIRLGIDNTPSANVIANLLSTAELGEIIRAALNEGRPREVYIITTSGYRCEALEKVICAKDYERWCKHRDIQPGVLAWRMYFRSKSHPKGQSLDFKAPRFGTPRQIVQFIASRPEIMAKIDQIIMEGISRDGGGWVHVGWSDNPRHEVKVATFNNDGVPSYSWWVG